MSASRFRSHAAALLGYICLGLLFSWPLPLHSGDALLGPPEGDTGVYVWNLWVFRHEVLAQHSPFFTSTILPLVAPVPLSLQNYTGFADLVALPLLPAIGTIATFNLLTIGSGVVAAYAMFLFAWSRTGDATAAWVAGVLFGFSPFMSARATGHFSLAQTAPLPVFCLLMDRIARRPSMTLAASAGLVVAWAFACDPYYAVYCLLMALVMGVYAVVGVDLRWGATGPTGWTRAVDAALVCVAVLIAWIAMRGGGVIETLGIRVTISQLQNPVLIFSVLAGIRIWLTLRPRFSVTRLRLSPVIGQAAVAGAACAVVLSPVLIAMASPAGNPLSSGAPVLWRSSAPGVDAAAWLLPNPLHPWIGHNAAAWLARLPNGFVENVASLPWVAVGTIAGAIWFAGHRPQRDLVSFTATFAVLSLGPFIHVAGFATYIPTPWALLRYLPIIGAARMPTRLTILVMLGLSMLLAMAVRHWRGVSRRPRLLVMGVTTLLVAELLPAPRTLHPAHVPNVFRIVAADPRSTRVLNLPFGLHDGLVSRGNQSAVHQYYQTLHGKPLVGGYLSRLPGGTVARYEDVPLMRALLDLSEGLPLDPERADLARQHARMDAAGLNIGWVVVETSRASPELVAFARTSLELQLMATDDSWQLYSVPPWVP